MAGFRPSLPNAVSKSAYIVHDAQCFAPIFSDSLANLVKSLLKHRRRMVRRIALRNFCREEFFGRALMNLRLSFSRCPSFTQVRIPLNELV